MSRNQCAVNSKNKPSSSGAASSERSVLVKLIGGREDGRMDIVKKISWMKNFDETAWKSMTPLDRRNKSEVLEWKEGKKSAGGTWPTYDCEVIEISDNVKKLKMKKREMEKNRDSSKDKASVSSDEEEDEVLEEAKEEIDNNFGKKTNADNASKILENKKKKVKSNAAKSAAGNTSEKVNNRENSNDRTPKKKKTDVARKVPIYKGSVYYVDKRVYDHAKRQDPREFVTTMLRQLFSEEVLVVSNLSGRASTTDRIAAQRWPLDQCKRLAITYAAVGLFPGLSISRCHGYISQFIVSLRSRLKRNGKLEEYEEMGRKKLPVEGRSSDENTNEHLENSSSEEE